jgi:hypothetical protein
MIQVVITAAAAAVAAAALLFERGFHRRIPFPPSGSEATN